MVERETHTAAVTHTASPGLLGPGLQSLVIFAAAFGAAWPLGVPGDWMGLWGLGAFALSMGVLAATASFWWRRTETGAALELVGDVLRFPGETPLNLSSPHELSVRVAGGVAELRFGSPLVASVIVDGFDRAAAEAALGAWFVRSVPEVRADFKVHVRLDGATPLAGALVSAAGRHRDRNDVWRRWAAYPWDAPPAPGGPSRMVSEKPAEQAPDATLLWPDPHIGAGPDQLVLQQDGGWMIVPLGPGVTAALETFTVRSAGGADEQVSYLELVVTMDGAEHARVRSSASRHVGAGGGANRVDLEALVAFVAARAGQVS